MMRRAGPHITPRVWLRLPRRTARLRLTLFYGGLFLASGVTLLAITYVLAVLATGIYVLPGGKGDVVLNGSAGARHPATVSPAGHRPTAAQLHQLQQLQAAALRQHESDLHWLLLNSAIALGVMAVLAVAVGWVVADRVLRPLRTITATARRISASNLHERLALDGPDDEFKELGDTLDNLLSRLDTSFESQRHFVANAAHELRTPLTVDRTLLQVAIGRRGSTDARLHETWQALLTSNAQQGRLIEALLTLATSERGLERWDCFDLGTLAADVLADHAAMDHDDVQVHSALGTAMTQGDPELARQLVANLVENAFRHNLQGGWIEIVTGIKSGLPVIAVRNSGPVVPEEDAARLFEPFERLGRQRGSGHGLGLSIVRAIAQAHGATISPRTRPDGGMDIAVCFPAETIGPRGPASSLTAGIHLAGDNRAKCRRAGPSGPS